ncbi:Gfo/Idh/MocA family protein [Metabacillus endolithicus]|uniref:Gfo/Idh/MocA family protein n=1 Tax=Metabacillus endolithicus TaxID=1535204 RepID=A0ABW5BZL3_9BACI|nr:Gfo/Idh/MocA family oxidoreductase [Metabacillus endolithicus]UPG62591.1 Gfo/Idh/MocA family oxidoreductase [Metabacillus endolithicus]
MVGVNKKKLRIGMVGYKFMGKAHSHAYRDVSFYFDNNIEPVLQAICGRNEEAVKEAANKMGWLSYETDWKKLIARDDIDLIDIVTPNNAHTEIAIAAAEAGKHVFCEKPLAMTLEQSIRMLKAVEENGVIHMVNYNYRFAPATQFAKKIIEDGRLGKIYHIRATYLQDWIMDPNFPLVWRLDKDVCGSGSHGDLAAHIIDMARFLVGEFKEVSGLMETFIKERPVVESSSGLSGKASSNKLEEVKVDDASVFIAKFENGAIGTFEATRFAGGNKNGNRFEINGEKGSIRWDGENMNNLQVYFHDDEPGIQGFRTINCTEETHPFAGAYWPVAHIIGYEHTFINLLVELLNGIDKGYNPSPNFIDGVKNQAILEAVEQSARTKQWVSLNEMSVGV